MFPLQSSLYHKTKQKLKINKIDLELGLGGRLEIVVVCLISFFLFFDILNDFCKGLFYFIFRLINSVLFMDSEV